MDVYPGGEEDSDEGYVATNLVNRSNTGIKVQYGYSVRGANGKEVAYEEPDTAEFGALGSDSNAWFAFNFAKGFMGIWFQMLIVTSFAVMFSTFLNGPVAMLATVAAICLGFFAQFVNGLFTGDVEGGARPNRWCVCSGK